VNAAHPAAIVDIRVITDHRALPEVVDYARDRIGALVRAARRPVPSVRVRLSRHGKPDVPWTVVAQANMFVDGVPVRAQAEGGNSWEAVDRLEARLRYQLSVPRECRFRSDDAPSHCHRWYVRPEGERRIVRRKSCALRRCTVEEAALEMLLLDYEFHLFVEAGTGQDALLCRAGVTGYRLTLVTPPAAGAVSVSPLPLTVSAEPAPRLSVEEAIARSNESGLPFLFFLDPGRNRGAVLYRRYDGHYGLITPSAENLP
jgi:hypothetical protein